MERPRTYVAYVYRNGTIQAETVPLMEQEESSHPQLNGNYFLGEAGDLGIGHDAQVNNYGEQIEGLVRTTDNDLNLYITRNQNGPIRPTTENLLILAQDGDGSNHSNPIGASRSYHQLGLPEGSFQAGPSAFHHDNSSAFEPYQKPELELDLSLQLALVPMPNSNQSVLQHHSQAMEIVPHGIRPDTKGKGVLQHPEQMEVVPNREGQVQMQPSVWSEIVPYGIQLNKEEHSSTSQSTGGAEIVPYDIQPNKEERSVVPYGIQPDKEEHSVSQSWVQTGMVPYGNQLNKEERGASQSCRGGEIVVLGVELDKGEQSASESSKPMEIVPYGRQPEQSASPQPNKEENITVQPFQAQPQMEQQSVQQTALVPYVVQPHAEKQTALEPSLGTNTSPHAIQPFQGTNMDSHVLQPQMGQQFRGANVVPFVIQPQMNQQSTLPPFQGTNLPPYIFQPQMQPQAALQPFQGTQLIPYVIRPQMQEPNALQAFSMGIGVIPCAVQAYPGAQLNMLTNPPNTAALWDPNSHAMLVRPQFFVANAPQAYSGPNGVPCYVWYPQFGQPQQHQQN